jgi:hypothetical protein
LPDINNLVEKLERAYCLACAKELPAAMVMAATAQARLLGLIVDRQAVVHAHVDPAVLQGSIEEGRQRIFEKLAERVGSHKARRALAFIEQLQEEPDKPDDVIDGEVADE